MKADELAFLNRQLAGMLRDGVPLEGALRGASREMASGSLQTELGKLELDLAAGIPLADAIERRAFPPVYRKMVRVGAASGDLPGALLAAADYFESAAELSRRAQAVMVYPACLLVVVTVVSWIAGWVFRTVKLTDFDGGFGRLGAVPWAMPALLGVVALAWTTIQIVPAWRHWIAWRLPVLRDARVARAANTLSVLVTQGCPFPEAVGLLGEMERGTPLAEELEEWQLRMASGTTQFSAIVAGPGDTSLFPPLFRWLVAQAGSRLGEGLAAAGQFYANRSRHGTEMLLHGAMPLALVFVGLVMVAQFMPLLAWMGGLVDQIGAD